MSPTSHIRPAAPAATRALNRLAVWAGRKVKDERTRRGWSGRALAARAGISGAYVSEIESGVLVSLDTYARVFTALDLPLDLAADRRERATFLRGQDFVHAAMGELEAQRLRHFGYPVGIDEPYQHYQFAGRADIVAWDLGARALLHIENRTQFPNVQESLGSFGAKRVYLGSVLAERAGIGSEGWASETHVIAALWSGEVTRAVRMRETTFRVACPDELDPFDRWWAGRACELSGNSVIFALMDPAPTVRESFRFGSLDRVQARPRYADYAGAAERLKR